MILERLLAHFDAYTLLPIDVNTVRDQLVELGVQDQIRFHFVRMDKDKIRGLLHRYVVHRVPYAEPTFCSDIIIPQDMGDESEAWQRLVAVKELLHITDCDNLSATSEKAVDNLFNQFSLPPELRDPMPLQSKSFLNDRVRIYTALAVLVPAGCREALRPLYRDKHLTSREIAEIAGIPQRYVQTVMDDEFDSFIEAFCTWERAEIHAEKAAAAPANTAAEPALKPAAKTKAAKG